MRCGRGRDSVRADRVDLLASDCERVQVPGGPPFVPAPSGPSAPVTAAGVTIPPELLERFAREAVVVADRVRGSFGSFATIEFGPVGDPENAATIALSPTRS